MVCDHEDIERMTHSFDVGFDGKPVWTVGVEILWCPYCGGTFWTAESIEDATRDDTA
jgi:hypothetical protein